MNGPDSITDPGQTCSEPGIYTAHEHEPGLEPDSDSIPYPSTLRVPEWYCAGLMRADRRQRSMNRPCSDLYNVPRQNNVHSI